MSLLDEYYDRRDNPPEDTTKKIVFAILDELDGRKGFDCFWDEIDGEVREEILGELISKTRTLVG